MKIISQFLPRFSIPMKDTNNFNVCIFTRVVNLYAFSSVELDFLIAVIPTRERGNFWTNGFILFREEIPQLRPHSFLQHGV